MNIGKYSLMALCLVLTACSGTGATYDPFVAAVDNQLQTREIQTRVLDAPDYDVLVTAVISTLQDYHFRIGNIDPDLGTVTAYQMTRFDPGMRIGGHSTLTVLIRPQGENRYRVRMNMSTGPDVENEPELYQQFFSALDRRLHTRI